jgi:hypothetical protein
MDVQNLAKFEWENDIPFSVEVVNKTLHATLGEGGPGKPDFVLGFLNYNNENKKWGINSVDPTHNDTFGTHGFGQVNSSFSITVKSVNEKTTNMKIIVSARQGNFIGGGNQAYLQDECQKFITALSYYLEHQDMVDNWVENYKPQTLAKNAQQKNNKGCALFIPFFIGVGGLATYVLSSIL